MSSRPFEGISYLARPAELGGRGTGVGVNLACRRPGNFPRDLGIVPSAQAGLEGFFYPAIFTRMKGQNCNPSARIKAIGEMAQEGVERGEFVVDRDAQSLEHTPDREFAIITVQAGQGV